MENKNMDKNTGEGIGFERIRRITGYLVGTVDRFNDAKHAELNDRVVHADLKNSKDENSRNR